MWIFYLGGFAGGVIGTFLGVWLGGAEAASLGAMVGIVLGLVSPIIFAAIEEIRNPEPKLSEEEKAEQLRIRFEEHIKHFKGIFQVLPKDEIDKIEKTVDVVLGSFDFNAENIPMKLSQLHGAIKKIKEEGKYGTITVSQRIEIEKLLNAFSSEMMRLISFSYGHINQAASKGLGFGVLGSATDVALYSVMDTLEKNKNLKKATHAVNSFATNTIDQLIYELAVEVQKRVGYSVPCDTMNYVCPQCNHLLKQRAPSCEKCGQIIDWSMIK